MHFIDLLSAERIEVDASARSKKRALELASELLVRGQPELSARDVFASLCARERLGSTGFGHGVALPHGRIDGCRMASGAFLHLKEPVDFEASDRVGVDLLFAIVVPGDCEERHLQLLAQLATLVREGERLDALRRAADPSAVLKLFEEWQSEAVSG